MKYLVEIVRADQSDHPVVTPAGRHEYLLRVEGGRFPGGQFTSTALEWNHQLLADLEALRSPRCSDETQQRVGNQLRRFLGRADWGKHEVEIERALAQGPVYLTIRAAAAEMFLLPWELLTIEATGEHIAEREGLFLGYAWPGMRREGAENRHGLDRVLFAWSAAGGQVPSLGHQRALAPHPGFDGDADVVAHASLTRLAKALKAAAATGRPVSVLHLLCHGARQDSGFGLVLSDGEGEQVLVSPSRLRRLLRPYADTLRLVVLSACDGGNPGAPGTHLGSVAQALHRIGIQWVIASRYPLSRAGSIDFAEAFYNHLFDQGRSVEEAFSTARRALVLDPAHRDWASLQLYVGHENRGSDGSPVPEASVKLLYCAGSPGEGSRLDRGPAHGEILAALRRARWGARVKLVSRSADDPTELLEALGDERPAIVHFGKHDQGYPTLLVRAHDGCTTEVSGEQLAELFRITGSSVRLLVLNACATPQQERALLGAVDCVVATSAALPDEVAIDFAAALYRALASGFSVAAAFAQARWTIALADEAMREVPVLRSRPGIDPDEVVLLPGVDEQKPRDVPDLEALAALLARWWSGERDLRELLGSLRVSDQEHVPEASDPAAFHWLLLTLAGTHHEQLRALAAMLAGDRRFDLAADVLRNMAGAIDADRWPSGLDEIWMSLRREDTRWTLALRVPGERVGSPHVAGRLDLDAGERVEVGAGVSVAVEQRGAAARIRVTAGSDAHNPLLGMRARIWTGVGSVARTLRRWATDRLGPDTDVLLLEELIPLPEPNGGG